MLAGRTSAVNAPYRKRTTIKDDDFFAIKDYISNARNLQENQNLKSADAAVAWERKSAGYRIVDLRMDRFMQALRFILNHYFPSEPTCEATGLYDDAVSVKIYLPFILIKMCDMRSFCALQEGTDEFVGVLVASLIPSYRPRLETELIQGQALFKIMTLKNHVVAMAQNNDTPNTDNYLCIDALCVKSGHQQKGVGTALVRSCVARASEFSIPACIGEFTSGAGQLIAERLGFEKLSEIKYQTFQFDGKKPFERCHPENHSIMCMKLSVELPEPPPLTTPTSAPSTQKSDKTVSGKRKRARKRR